MRIAVIADIHGILPAVDAFLVEMASAQVDGIIIAGDLVGGPCSNEVVGRLRPYQRWMIRGNWEDYILRYSSGNIPEWWLSKKQFAFARWNYESIDGATLEFLKSLPEQRRVEFPGMDPLRVVHGSPNHVSELISPQRDISSLDRALEQVAEPVVIFGHTHRAWIMERHGKLALNPGSLGMSFNKECCGTYAMLEWQGQHWKAKLRKLRYDIRLLQQVYIETGLLEKAGAFARCCLASVECGIDYVPPMLEYVHQKAQEAGYADSPFVPDDVWDEATRSFEQLHYPAAF